MKVAIKNLNCETIDIKEIKDTKEVRSLINWFNRKTAIDESSYFEVIE